MATTLTPLQVNAVKTNTSAPAMGYVNRYDASSGPLSVSLPALSGLNVSARVMLQKYKLDATVNTVTFSRAGSDQFDDGSTSLVLTESGESRTLQVVLISGVKRWKVMESMGSTVAVGGSSSNVVSVKDYGAVGNGSTDDTAAINNAVSAAVSAKEEVYFPAGTYKITSALDWRIDGLQVRGAGSYNTAIMQFTSNVPVVQVAGSRQSIGGLQFQYATQRPDTETSANCMTFGAAGAPSFMSHFYDIRLYRGCRAMYISPTATASGLFSCLFENISILGYSLDGINLDSPDGAGHTGCVFNNIYIQNGGDNTDATGNAVYLKLWAECVFNQLNIEWCNFTGTKAMEFNSCENIVINGLHCEGNNLSVWGAGLMQVVNSNVLINGAASFNNTFSASNNPIFNFFGTGRLTLNSMRNADNTVTSTTHPLIDFGSATNAVAVIDDVDTAETTALTANGDASDRLIHAHDAEQFITLTSAYTVVNGTAVQKLFNSSTNGAVTLPGDTTYFFECQFSITGLSSSAHTVGFGFDGTASITRQLWQASALTTSTPGTPAAPAVSVQTATAAITTSGTATGLVARVTGKLVVGAGGTLIPSVQQNTNAAAAIVGNDSYFRIWPAGPNTVARVGAWS